MKILVEKMEAGGFKVEGGYTTMCNNEFELFNVIMDRLAVHKMDDPFSGILEMLGSDWRIIERCGDSSYVKIKNNTTVVIEKLADGFLVELSSNTPPMYARNSEEAYRIIS